MRITRNQLRQIIQEELGRTLSESPSSFDLPLAGAKSKKSPAKLQTPMSKEQWDSSMSKLKTSERLRFLKAIIDSDETTSEERTAYETEIGEICSKYSDLEGCPKK